MDSSVGVEHNSHDVVEMNRYQTVAFLRWQRIHFIAQVFICSAVSISLLCLGGTVWYGSIGSALAVMKGKPLLVEPWAHNINTRGLKVIPVVFELHNPSHTAISVVGSKSSCDCVGTNELPIQLGPGERTSLQFIVHIEQTASEYHGSITLYTDVPTQPELRLAIRAYEGATVGRQSLKH
jgi:hypothetical protein